MPKKQQTKQIVHPDQFIEGIRYSVLLEAVHGYKRCTGTFIDMLSEWCTLCQRWHLLIRLKRNNGKIGVVCWNDMGVRDWREVN